MQANTYYHHPKWGALSNRDQRSGKWTLEEQAYVKELIRQFEAGTLEMEEGVSLRSFLSKALSCNPKRISKKFEGTNYNGKQVYSPSSKIDPVEARKHRAKLESLKLKFQESLRVLKLVEASKQASMGLAIPSSGPLQEASYAAAPMVENNVALPRDILQRHYREAARLQTDLLQVPRSLQSAESSLFLSAYLEGMKNAPGQPLSALLATGVMARPPESQSYLFRPSARSLPPSSSDFLGTFLRHPQSYSTARLCIPSSFDAMSFREILPPSSRRRTSSNEEEETARAIARLMDMESKPNEQSGNLKRVWQGALQNPSLTKRSRLG